MYRKKFMIGILMISLIMCESKVFASELNCIPRMNMESVLTDKIYNKIYLKIYKVNSYAKPKGEEIAEYACKYVGNPYVWGGTSLTEGADCSGFVQTVYRKFGIELPRTSFNQREVGREVKYENAAPGDLICYEGHVGIYIGNGKIVNARNYKEGIGITSATYAKILTVRRVI